MDITPEVLRDYMAQAFSNLDDLEISQLVSINDGWESDVYRFQADWGAQDNRHQDNFILRIFPGDDAREKSAREYEALTMLWRAGYPVPRAYLLERDHSPFGRPFMIMERILGKDMWGAISSSQPQEQARLLEIFCGLFARLHSLDWRPFVADPERFEPDSPNGVVELELSRWQPFIDALPAPGFKASFQWLRDHLPEVQSTRAVPVHWDFHPGNVLLTGPDQAVVIDWTGFDLTDYRFDLAWTLLLLGSIEGMHWREMLLREYELQARHKVEGLEFFDVACALRRLFSVVASVTYGPEKLGMRPGAEQAMRGHARALLRVYQLLLERTGLPVPEVEQFLAEAGSPVE